ncbi:glycoside hydrolase family 55 protein [Paenibacillus oenotherae]|uniref:Glycoside hydrolase family 55 protein n=1 Tax=Paenibacillus oenotherae TaxID=1435645 RepID=A0ABS7DAG3_9BACL|nr:glycoside hydrolase family 55 protein [Paenibacillus oenotherae]MBW7476743.1 glycoside hydrolase family 55 protein [Paenibacillus oenotherae]
MEDKDKDKKLRMNRRELLGIMGSLGVGLAAGSSLLSDTFASAEAKLAKALPADAKNMAAAKVQGDNTNIVSVTDIEFGAVGNGRTDDTRAVQKAINYVSNRGGGVVYFPPGTYKIASTSNDGGKTNRQMEIPAGDNGKADNSAPLPLEKKVKLPYCIQMMPNVVLVGESDISSKLVGDYVYGAADLTQKVMFALLDSTNETAYNHGMVNLSISNTFLAYAGLDKTFALCQFKNLKIRHCAIGIYAKILERCIFESLNIEFTGVGILVGGQWRTRNDIHYEEGGFADKCIFRRITYKYNKKLSESAKIDKFFDQYFFKEANNTSRLVKKNQGGVATLMKYRGIAGVCIAILPRHWRPSNSNTFEDFFIANTPRYGFYGGNVSSSVFQTFNFENCGFDDGVGIGSGKAVDTYLGKGVRIPAFIIGLDASSMLNHIHFQACFADKSVDPVPQRIGLDEGAGNDFLSRQSINKMNTLVVEGTLSANLKSNYNFMGEMISEVVSPTNGVCTLSIGLPVGKSYLVKVMAKVNGTVDNSCLKICIINIYVGDSGYKILNVVDVGSPTYSSQGPISPNDLTVSAPDSSGNVKVKVSSTNKVKFDITVQAM